MIQVFPSTTHNTHHYGLDPEPSAKDGSMLDAIVIRIQGLTQQRKPCRRTPEDAQVTLSRLVQAL